MKKHLKTIGAIAAAVIPMVLALAYWAYQENTSLDPRIPLPISPPGEVAAPHPSFLYGRVALQGEAAFEGRLRWGRDQEAFWGDYFNGFKIENPWAAHLPSAQTTKPVEIFGLQLGNRQDRSGLTRPFMARFGDIARLEMSGRIVRATLKSGTVVDLDYYSATDFDDGVRVWDAKQGVVDISARQIRTVDFLPAPAAGAVPDRLQGTVRTRHGDFTGFVQWNRTESLGDDTFDGFTSEGEAKVRFDTIRSISRRSDDSSLLTLNDGREVTLSGSREAGKGNLGVYVDDSRYGRVLISWDAFERLDLTRGGSGPGYADFAAGQALSGVVITRDGRRLNGRLVYDLDESETTETLDAPADGVDYTILFGLISSITPSGVKLHNGEELKLERAGDLSERNGGVLVFADANQRPGYVPWGDIERIEFLALHAGGIKVMTSGAFTAPYLELGPRFERNTMEKVVTLTTTMGVGADSIPSRIARGEAVDVVIVNAAALDQLIRDGKVVAGSRVDLAKSDIGLAVRSGARKPDISSLDALKRTLLQAKSIAYSASVSGDYLSTELFQRLGIADQVLPKSRRIVGERVGAVVARGDAEIGFQQVSELLPIPGIDLVGPLPPGAQRTTVFSAGVAVNAHNPEAARAFIKFLVSAESAGSIRKSGLEPLAKP